MLANAMWRLNITLHGKNNNIILPSLLVISASCMVVYRHFNDEEGGDPTKQFLALIVLQMLPLIFLEMKILSCPDPVAMLSGFGTKVLLMHSSFLALRVLAWPMLEIGLGWCNLFGLLAACVALHFGFRFRGYHFQRHLDVVGLTVLAAGAALVTELLNFNRPASLLECTIFTASSYVELLAFVPAVWIVYQTVKKNDDTPVSGSSRVQTQAAFFFAFLVPFYIMEDLISAFRAGRGEPFTAIGHVVHFLLLLDFACFLMSHIYNPNQLHGSFLRWLPGQLFV
mmetsp:Transcript_79572/g.140743  ORF Transcript_79572/g.140743 Transcript_79572/m.140743 type:complete len:283 (-) Transcript_79572:112-960(-)